MFANDNPLNATDALGTAEVAMQGGGVPTVQEQQGVVVSMEDDAMKTLGVGQATIDLINRYLYDQYEYGPGQYVPGIPKSN